MRVTSALWVSALVRRASAEGAFATVASKGAEEAGAIFVLLNHLDGMVSLLCPAPQLQYESDGPSERLFEYRLQSAPAQDANQIIEKEQSFDPDIWVVEIEDKAGRTFIDPELIVSLSR